MSKNGRLVQSLRLDQSSPVQDVGRSLVGVATPGQTNVQPVKMATYVLYALCGRTIMQKEATVYVQ